MSPLPTPLPSLPSAEARGVVRAILHSALHYVDARVEIARLEGRQAWHEGKAMVVLGTLFVFSLAAAYAGGILALAWWLSLEWGTSSALPVIITLVGGHLLVAAGCAASLLRTWRRTRFFHATRKEFMEDKRWLEESQTFKS